MQHPEPLPAVEAHHRRGIYLTVALLLAFVVILVGGFVYTMLQPRPLTDAQLRANNTFLFEQVRDIGQFALVDDENRPFTPASLRGRWSLLFFGYTFCPDICPTTLALLSQFYGQLKPEYAKDTQIVMVSVDPARDTPAKLHQYVDYFNTQFRGVTGEFMALQQFATSLNVPFRKVPGGGDHYAVEHSGNIVIIDPNGHYIGFFRAPHDVGKLIQSYRSIRITRG